MKKLFLIGNIFLPQIAVAAGYTLLEPSLVGLQKGASVGLIQYLQLAFNTLITVSIILAIAYLVYGGALYILSGIPGQVSKGKEVIENALIGLALVLTSWLILHTINPKLTTLSLNLSTPGTGSGVSVSPVNTGPSPTGGGNNNPGGGAVIGPSGMTHQEVMSKLKPGIEIKPGVDMAGVQQTAIDGINQIKTDCPDCKIIINSATGDIHSTLGPYSHINGYKFDVGHSDPKLNKYITDNFTRAGTLSGYPRYVGKGNNANISILDEGNHWDIQFKP